MAMPEKHSQVDNSHRYMQGYKELVHPIAELWERMDAEEDQGHQSSNSYD